MTETKIYSRKSWEMSFIELKNTKGKKYKVTRRMPSLKVAETKVYISKKAAKKQFDGWLKQAY